jgi:16S rRNA (guanine(966)-N(2))-methyltransferase RsmD
MAKIYTNIISGKYKNRKILLPSHTTTRASKKIIRESFFNTIAFDIIDTTFIETFAGSGSIGIEALSRGANKVLFFEKDKKAFDILNENLQSLDIDNNLCFLGDTFDNLLNKIQDIPKAYFYFDPPFSIRDGYEEIYNKTILLISQIPISQIHLVCIEHSSEITFDNNIGKLEKIKIKKFGKSTLSYFGVGQ